MKLNTPLTRGVFVERYKRFFGDVKLADGSVVTAHCANSGSMMNVKEPGSPVWISANQNPKAKLDWRWEMIEIDGAKVGINTMHPNRIVEEAILDNKIKELTGYKACRREVKYGKENSRIDLLLEDPNNSKLPSLCYVEVKNVTLKRENRAEFPDSVTSRGAKHLRELLEMVKE
ncbi:MAG: DNA/RNA nuclease SfsA, partial [Sphingomonadales bacterium]